MTLPEPFKETMKELLKEDYAQFIDSYSNPPKQGLRANTLKITPQKLNELLQTDLEPVRWCNDGFYYPEGFRPAKSPLYHAGLYYIQEPSAMSSASMLQVSSGDKVLDLCAAPGGKSTHLCAKLEGKGILVSNDISASRCKFLIKNIELMGITNAIVTSETPNKLASRFPKYFDKILVDAPCSGEGMFRKDKDTLKAWDETKPLFFSKIQKSILQSASEMLADGGHILYSTCTFNKTENENIIEEFLKENTDFEMASVDFTQYGFEKGFSDNVNISNSCGRIFPHKVDGEGHFIAYIQKKDKNNTEHFENYTNKKNTQEKNALKYFFEFCEQNLNVDYRDKSFDIIGNNVFLAYDDLPPLKGLRIMKGMLYMGELKKNRFEPSQAFAMALKMNDAKNFVNFPLHSDEVIKYLKGESFDYYCNDGWNLICVEGFPLGWGKCQNGRIKNKYLKSWLMN